MKGIILAGGSGTRLHPLTLVTSKQLLPVYNKPMIYYPLTTLMLAGVREIMIITTPHDQAQFQALLGNGEQWGISLTYGVQPKPEGLAQAFIIGRDFVGDDSVALVLGDNIFFGHSLVEKLRRATLADRGATVFAYWVADPERYGVISFDDGGRATEIVEKPTHPTSNWAVTGLYFYDNLVLDIAASIKPSPRGELEITDVNRAYLDRGDLRVQRLGRGFAWLDTGTHQALAEASEYVRIIEHRQGQPIAAVEEVAYKMGYIDAEQLVRLAEPLRKSGYGERLLAALSARDLQHLASARYGTATEGILQPA